MKSLESRFILGIVCIGTSVGIGSIGIGLITSIYVKIPK